MNQEKSFLEAVDGYHGSELYLGMGRKKVDIRWPSTIAISRKAGSAMTS